jgi:hypothetical protein
MSRKPADILAAVNVFEEFRNGILSMSGDFPFGTKDMLELGKVYFIRFPDTSDNRNMDNIRMGYRIVRVCILEKILQGIDDQHRVMVRSMLDDMLLMDNILDKLVKEIGIGAIEEYRTTVSRNLDGVRSLIDELPRGMIKERFVGGISKFYNELYLLDNAIDFIKKGG